MLLLLLGCTPSPPDAPPHPWPQASTLAAINPSNTSPCLRGALDLLHDADEQTHGLGLQGFEDRAVQRRVGLQQIDVCLSTATDEARAAAALELRASLQRAPSPNDVMWTHWRRADRDEARLMEAFDCRWDQPDPPTAAQQETVAADLRAWRRQHVDTLANSRSLAHDDQLTFLTTLAATDPVPCLPPDPLTWRLGAALAPQYTVWSLLEKLVERNPLADDQLRDELYNRQTRAVMERVLSPASQGIDVGTFEGELLKDLVEVAPSGHHLGFEPIPSLLPALQARFSADRVTIHPVALGDSAGQATFTVVVDKPGYSGFRERVGQDGPTVEITVQVQTLDGIIGTNAPPTFLKIDVEGAELLVLQGARATLAKQATTVVFEFGDNAKSYGATGEAMWTFFAELDLELHTLSGWLRGDVALGRSAFLEVLEGEYYFLAGPKR